MEGREERGKKGEGNREMRIPRYPQPATELSLTAKRSTLSTILAQSISLKGWRELRAVGMIHCWKITRFTFRMNSCIIMCVCVHVCRLVSIHAPSMNKRLKQRGCPKNVLLTNPNLTKPH